MSTSASPSSTTSSSTTSAQDRSVRSAVVAAATVLLLVLVGCASSGDDDTTGDGPTTAFGEPADASEADRVVEVSMTDDYRYDPAELTVAAGEVITFEITNDGNLEHEFVLGDARYQADHGSEMEEMEGMDHGEEESNAVSLMSGESASVTWRFGEAGEVFYACHVPGHYEQGMESLVTVT